MTSLLRRKRRTTVRERNTLIRTAASLLGLGLLFAAATAQAQQASSAVVPTSKWRQAPQASASTPAVAAETPLPTLGPVVPLHTDFQPPPEPIQSTSLQERPARRPADEVTSSTSTYAMEDLKAPIPLGLREGGPNPVARLESEAAFNRRIAQKVRQTPTTGLPVQAVFPEEPVVSREKFAARLFPGTSLLVEPNYVCYGRLYFQERNSERYGWDLGIIQPAVSTGVFFADLVTLPYKCGADICAGPECSAGQCLPGDPIPYMIYPPHLSLTGAVTEAGAIAGLLAIFP